MSIRRLLLPLSVDAGFVVDSPAPVDGAVPEADASVADAADAADAAKVLPDGMLEPIPYLSRADSPFKGVVFPAYSHFEDFEDHLLNTPGVTSSSNTMSSSFGPTLIDSIDGDDGTIDGKCAKVDGTCDALFGGGGAAGSGVAPSMRRPWARSPRTSDSRGPMVTPVAMRSSRPTTPPMSSSAPRPRP